MVRTHLEKNYAELSRTNEHLESYGSYFRDRVSDIRSELKSHEGPRFAEYRAELGSVVYSDEVNNKKRSAEDRANNIQKALKNLPPGQSLIMASGDHLSSGGHATVMRFTHNLDGTFDLQFANTGAGLTNSDFHPKEGHLY